MSDSSFSKGINIKNTLLQGMLETLSNLVTPGATTQQIDDMAAFLCKTNNVKSAFLGYNPRNFGKGFPATCCVSINDEVIHGIPSDRILIEGDVVKLDIGIEQEGQYDDGAVTVLCATKDKDGKLQGTSAIARKLVKATKEALEAGIAQAKTSKTTHDIASAIEATAKKYDLHVVHGYCGHGIGDQLHMEPRVPNELDGSPAVTLTTGQRLAIEPMFSTNNGYTYVAEDGWTVKLHSGLAAHFERTITVT